MASTATATPASTTAGDDRSASSIVFCPTSGFHLLKIDGYSRTEGMLYNRCIQSRPFSIGGHNWCIDLYPNGKGYGDIGYMSVFLCLNSPAVMAQYGISLVHNDGTPHNASPRHRRTFYFGSTSFYDGHGRFFKNQDLEPSGLLVDDCFTIKVDIALQGVFPFRAENIAVAQALAPKPPPPPPPTVVPPPTASLQRHLGDLLSSKEGADVTFMVGDEVFAAHRYILAARSPVFKAQLFGAMKERTSTKDAVLIEDMAPQVFEALLYFLYTDCLPSSESETPPTEQDVMTQHLLVAADRYDLDKLKLICEERLCECIDASNAVTILALAEQHSCAGLKQACLNFIRSTNYV